MNQIVNLCDELDASLVLERPRLVGLCARLTNNSQVAEDLAQETLLEAWRHLSELRDKQKFSQWLSGIARNVCLRWMRKQGKDTAHLASLSDYLDPGDSEQEDQLADAFDLEIQLERKELIELLDRALAFLPAETRSLLVERYMLESPLGEVAARLGIDTSVAAMRLQRGKLALRRVLATKFEQEVASYSLGTTHAAGASGWEETRLWCNVCGQHHFRGQYDPVGGDLRLTCPACCPDPEDSMMHTHGLYILGGVKGYKPALSRVYNWGHNYYQPNLLASTIPCPVCGQPNRLHRGPTEHPDLPPWHRNRRGLFHLCEHCSPPRSSWSSLEFLVLALPEGRNFQKEHPRIRWLPAREIETAGCPAIVTTFESVTSQDRFVVVSALDTYEVLRIEGGGR